MQTGMDYAPKHYRRSRIPRLLSRWLRETLIGRCPDTDSSHDTPHDTLKRGVCVITQDGLEFIAPVGVPENSKRGQPCSTT